MSLTNQEVAHLWANQSREAARSSNGNSSFVNRRYLSYATCVARLVDSPVTGETVALVTSASHSRTTNGKHLDAVWRAIRSDMTSFRVPLVDVVDVYHVSQEEIHRINLRHLLTEFRDEVARLAVSTDVALTKSDRSRLDRLHTSAFDYANTFAVTGPEADAVAEIETDRVFHEIEEARAARWARIDTPATREKREKDKARREKAKAEKAIREAAERFQRDSEDRRRFLMGERVYNWRLDDGETPRGALLRVASSTRNGEPVAVLETSWGASVPLDHAMRAFPLLAKCRETGKGWIASGHSIRVGDYAITEISPNGGFRAGCHWINWGEIERIARIVGLVAPTASATEEGEP